MELAKSVKRVTSTLTHLHRAFGTFTDISVLAAVKDYDHISAGPIVTAEDRAALMLAIEKKQVVEVTGRKFKLAFEGKAIFAFVNAYRDRYNALYSDCSRKQDEEADFFLRQIIARNIVTIGEDKTQKMLVKMSESEIVFTCEHQGPSLDNYSIDTMYIDGIKADLPGWGVRAISENENDPEVNARENARLVTEYKFTKNNLAEVLAQVFIRYDGEKPLLDFVQENYKPCGAAEKEIVNRAFVAAKISRRYEKPS